MLSGTWTTKNEIDFVMGLGTGQFNKDDLPRKSRVVMLRGYLAGSRLRDDWGNIKNGVVIDTAEALLEALETAEAGHGGQREATKSE